MSTETDGAFNEDSIQGLLNDTGEFKHVALICITSAKGCNDSECVISSKIPSVLSMSLLPGLY